MDRRGNDPHAIATDSPGPCPTTSALSGTWDAATLLVGGTYTTTGTCPPPPGGHFFAGKEGLTDMDDILDVLGLLRDFADRIEAESPAAADAFSSTYLNDGKTRADWQAQLAAMYAAYDSLHVTIDAVRQVVTFTDAEVNPQAIASPRLEWHLSVTGVPTGGGPTATVLSYRQPCQFASNVPSGLCDVTSTLFRGGVKQQSNGSDRASRAIVFKANG